MDHTLIEKLLAVIQNVAAGDYSNEIMELTGPGVPEPVRTIAEAMGLMMVKVEAREYRLEMMVEELRQLNEKIRQTTINTVSAMANALAARDVYTEGHAARVGEWSGRIARALGLDEKATERVAVAGRLHDIGKIGFPDRLFQPHEAQNPPEIIKEITKHPATGATILQELDFLGEAREYVHCHHERLDGRGYPRRLRAEDIPLGARIIAVADGFDAMTTNRPYQKGMPPAQAMAILRKQAPVKLDSDCVEAFARILEEDGVLPDS
ncbi:MAG TPA: HD domain-containing protein [Desulfonatronum sp.]|nr:HD domain-containing protein [Desulfonatronum sp.]